MKKSKAPANSKRPLTLRQRRILFPPGKEERKNRLLTVALAATITAALIFPGNTFAAPALRAISVPFKLMNRAEDLFQVLDGPQPIRTLLNCPTEAAPLCPQPEASTPRPSSSPRTPVRTFFQRRFR